VAVYRSQRRCFPSSAAPAVVWPHELPWFSIPTRCIRLVREPTPRAFLPARWARVGLQRPKRHRAVELCGRRTADQLGIARLTRSTSRRYLGTPPP